MTRSLALLRTLVVLALLIAGDARAADPVCHLSPHHARLAELAADRRDTEYGYRHS